MMNNLQTQTKITPCLTWTWTPTNKIVSSHTNIFDSLAITQRPNPTHQTALKLSLSRVITTAELPLCTNNQHFAMQWVIIFMKQALANVNKESNNFRPIDWKSSLKERKNKWWKRKSMNKMKKEKRWLKNKSNNTYKNCKLKFIKKRILIPPPKDLHLIKYKVLM